MLKNFTKLKDNPDTNSESSMNPSKGSKNKIIQVQHTKTTKTQRQRENILGSHRFIYTQGSNTQNDR